LLKVTVKKFVRFFAWVSSAILVSSLATNCDFAITMVGLAYLAIFLIVVYLLTEKSQPELTIILFVGLFSIGHVIKTGIILSNRVSYSLGGWQTIGSFNFSFAEMCDLFFVQGSGLLGSLLAYRLSSRFWKSQLSRTHNTFIPTNYGGPSNSLVWSWFFLGILLFYIMAKLNIGRHGMENSEEGRLPYHLSGLMLYLRNFVFFSFGCILMDLSLRSRTRYKFYLVLIMFAIATLIGAITSLSRSFVAGPLLPIVYYYLQRTTALIKLRNAVIVLVPFVLILVISSFVNLHRTSVYSGDESNIEESIENFSDPSKLVDRLLTLDFLISRIEGSRELMAVIASDLKGIGTFWQIFMGTYETLNEDIFGFSVQVLGRSYGMTLGMLGLFYTSQSYLIVFLGSFAYIFMVLSIEHKLKSLRWDITSNFIVLVIISNVWGNMVFFFFIRYFVSLAILYCLAKQVILSRPYHLATFKA
jgi:hypothetical protein